MRPSKRFKGDVAEAVNGMSPENDASINLFRLCEKLCLSFRSDLLESKVKGGNRGLYAKVDIPEDTVLFAHKYSNLAARNPSLLSFVSCMDRRKNDETIHAVYESLASHPDFNAQSFLATVVCLMVEITHLDTSHLMPYLEWLPALTPSQSPTRVNLDSISLWPEETHQYIRGTSVYKELVQFNKASRSSFAANLNQLGPLVAHLEKHRVKDFWAFYCRCCACVQAYSFTVFENEQSEVSANVMVPLMDAFNASVANQNVALFTRNDQLECVTGRNIAAGEELLNTFGEMTVADRLLRYGYAEETDEYVLVFNYEELCEACSRHTEVEKTIKALSKAASALEVELEEIMAGEIPLELSRSQELKGTLLYDILHEVATYTPQVVESGGCAKETTRLVFEHLAALLKARQLQIKSLALNGKHLQADDLVAAVINMERIGLDYWLRCCSSQLASSAVISLES